LYAITYRFMDTCGQQFMEKCKAVCHPSWIHGYFWQQFMEECKAVCHPSWIHG
jgi:hypothetical protein